MAKRLGLEEHVSAINGASRWMLYAELDCVGVAFDISTLSLALHRIVHMIMD